MLLIIFWGFFFCLFMHIPVFSSCPLTRRPATTCWRFGTDLLRMKCLWRSSVGLCSLRESTPRWTLSPFSSRRIFTSASQDSLFSSLVRTNVQNIMEMRWILMQIYLWLLLDCFLMLVSLCIWIYMFSRSLYNNKSTFKHFTVRIQSYVVALLPNLS